jgi:Delta24-sterol reductase
MYSQLPQHTGHATSLAHIAHQVRTFYDQKAPYRVYHGSTNSTRTSPYRHDNIVDISSLKRILEINVEDKLAFVEPNVPMDQLAAATLKRNLLPPVVMEFPGITAGGGYSGMSGESSSYRHGFFDQTVKMVEIIIGDGEVLCASEDSHAELFRGAATSCGTMGLVTMLCIQLIDAKPFLSLTYIRIHSMEEVLRRIKLEQDNAAIDYIDGMMFSQNSGVLCLGTMTDTTPQDAEMVHFSRPQDDWFYINAEDKSTTRTCWTELIPIEDYLSRYDRGAFWMGKYTYRYFAIPLNRLTRWALNRYTHTRMMYHALHRSGLSNQYIVQDIAIPYEHASEFLAYLDTNFRNYPIWLCPLKTRNGLETSQSGLLLPAEVNYGQIDMTASSNMMMNFGVWGPGQTDPDEFVSWNKAFEDKINSLGGFKWLYGHQYYTEQQFWEIYDKKKHDELRQKYKVSHLASLYDKVKVKSGPTKQPQASLWLSLLAFFWSIWPLAGLYGWWQCIVSEEYLLPQKP